MALPPTISLSTTGSDPKVATKENLEAQVNGAFTYVYNDVVQKADLLTVPQGEAEAGAATTRRAWTAERVRQAIVAWLNANMLTKFSTLGYGLEGRYPENGDVLTAIDGTTGAGMFKFSYGTLKTKLGLDGVFAPAAEIANRQVADEALSGDVASEAATRLAADDALAADYTAALDARVGRDGAPVDFASEWFYRGEKVVTAAVGTDDRPSYVQTEKGATLGGGLTVETGAAFYFAGKLVSDAMVDADGRAWYAMLADGSFIAPAADVVAGARINAWGDSLTYGRQGGFTVDYPAALSDILGIPVFNNGIGAQTSTQISMRQGGKVPRVTLAGNQIVNGANTITAIEGVTLATSGGMAPDKDQPFPLSSQSGNLERKAIVTIQGVEGVLRRTATGGPPSTAEVYTFTPTGSTNLPVTCPAQSPMRFTEALKQGGIDILWLGRNNNADPDTIKAHIALCVSQLDRGNRRFLVLSVLNGDYDAEEHVGGARYATITGLNADLEATYPGEFVDIRRLLISEGLTRAWIAPTAQDLTDIANDVPPSSLRTDNLHLNAAGYQVVAEIVAEQLRARGWVL
ncbi:hypothetical protein PVT71_13580 [Salipiger sp. H15]|uniref:SGNH hydrolase-type esterase domain-containing protein n=1 Tax=Alloyangia sp. H15 TaxID=3029062 RepID=A0AAU8AFY3_9RHOB